MSEQLKYPVQTQGIWNYINSKWDIEEAVNNKLLFYYFHI